MYWSFYSNCLGDMERELPKLIKEFKPNGNNLPTTVIFYLVLICTAHATVLCSGGAL